jgi:hypothetical protein
MVNAIRGTQIPTEENAIAFWQEICKSPRGENPGIDNDEQKDPHFNTLAGDPNIFYLSSQREGSGQRNVR